MTIGTNPVGHWWDSQGEYVAPIYDPADHEVRMGAEYALPPLLAPPGTAEQICSKMPEAQALVTIAQATDGAADPVFEVGPVANHLVGITCADRPDYHPHPGDLPSYPDAR